MAAILSSLFAFFISFPRIVTVLLWVLLLSYVDAQSPSADVQTLLKFKSVIDSGSLARGYWSTWNEGDENPCDWWGVTCTPTSTVEQLDLSGWELTRLPSLKVPSSLADLRKLDLSSNTFQNSTNSDLGIHKAKLTVKHLLLPLYVGETPQQLGGGSYFHFMSSQCR